MKRPKQSSYQQGEFQKLGERRTPGIPAVIGFIYVEKGVERGGSSSTHMLGGAVVGNKSKWQTKT